MNSNRLGNVANQASRISAPFAVAAFQKRQDRMMLTIALVAAAGGLVVGVLIARKVAA